MQCPSSAAEQRTLRELVPAEVRRGSLSPYLARCGVPALAIDHAISISLCVLRVNAIATQAL
eukprot:7731847-Pyramimonas_sp.AAC.1